MAITQSTESELLLASRRGESAAFGELVERCAHMVEAVSYARTGDRALAEDITQDTFVAAWRDLHRLRDASSLRPWLCSIARNLAHKARRRRAREIALPEEIIDERTPFEAVRDDELDKVLAAALAQVPEVYREALVLYYYEQQSTKDVARALGVSDDVVHKRVSRGRELLADGVRRMIENRLASRRTRKKIAAGVLAALPPFAIGSAAKASTKPMLWTLAGVAVLATATSGAASRAPAAAKTPPPAPHAAPRPSPTRHAPPRKQPPAPPAGPTCESVARHFVALSMSRFQTAAAEHPDLVELETAHVAEDCRDEKWTAVELACMTAATDELALHACRPAPPKPLVVAPPTPVDGDVDVSCKVVGTHVAELMIDSMEGTGDDNVAGRILVDTDGLPAQVRAECARAKWSDGLRRCFAAATVYNQIVACKRSRKE